MAISVADNFSYQGGKPLDARMKYDSVANMVAVPAANLYDGCFAYVTAEQKYYSYDSANEVDPDTGKWREYSGGGGGDVDPMPAEDMDDILTPLPGVMARSIYNSRFNRSDMYSTDEVLIGKWIDGKPLYQKTFTGTTPNSSSGISTGLTNVAFCMVKEAHVISNVSYVANTTFVNGNYAVSFDVKSDGSEIWFESNWDRFYGRPYYVTLRYTKTTDGTTKVDFDTDYSTDETIVGRWIDGKPVYQKTYNFTNVTVTGTDQLNFGDLSGLNYDHITVVELDAEDNYDGRDVYNYPLGGGLLCWVRKVTSQSPSSDGFAVKHLVSPWGGSTTYSKISITIRYTKTTD